MPAPSSSRLRYGIPSWGLSRERVEGFFSEVDWVGPLGCRLGHSLDAVLAWGTKPSSFSAGALAKRRSIPLIRVEDGFLYGLEPGSRRMSLVVDDLGIYYDASRPSRLETYLSQELSAAQMIRSQAIRGLWLEYGVSKYNQAVDWDFVASPWIQEPFLLLIDQTRGDQSIAGGLANASSFDLMLEAALSQSAIEPIVIKVHPEVIRGSKLGHYDLSSGSAVRTHPRIRVLADDISLPSVINRASAIYTVSSQAGFEGLLWDKPVHTFGMPFYAGWGLTQDHLARPKRRSDICVEQLIHGALVDYARYVHPETNEACEVEDLIEYLGFQRTMRNRFKKPLRPAYFSRNKLKHLRRFTQGCPWVNLSSSGARDSFGLLGSNILIWGNPQVSVQNDSELIRVEDGFIRSVGLGAALAKPYSWVFDRQGIYYDAQRVSDLEEILQNTSFDASLIERARCLQEQLLSSGITKYNLANSRSATSECRQLEGIKHSLVGRKILLVIGQVESDASIRDGGVDIFSNLELLRAVRDSDPDAFIVYKPHPDIAKSVRFAGKTSKDHRLLCDLVISELGLLECLPWIDSLHTISSLAGFEALIRGVSVYCYGLPFYAGWGLTHDRHCINRRSRILKVEELIAGALILYPTYVHPKTGLYCTPESLIGALQTMDRSKQTWFSRIANRYRNQGLELVMGTINRLKNHPAK